jgi:GTP-binding protein HflX
MKQFNETSIFSEPKKAVIVSLNLGDDELFYYQLEELKNLCFASNIEVVDTVTQNLNAIVPGTYIGSGKLNELKTIASALEADYVIFNDELSPSQIKNISEILGDHIEVIDRTMVILEIFASRARSKASVLQVEIAKLKYSLPRLVGLRSYLSRTAGGGAGGGGARRGLGETKLELDRRHIERRISKATEELKAITKSRENARKLRHVNNIPIVSVVGYTNAGKSSTINAILNYCNKDASKTLFAQDMLFATLDTTTRLVKLFNNHEFLITDTVGFFSKLPHHLIESFKSTLEEIKEADLIVHIIDASSPFMNLQIETTQNVLAELGASSIPTIYVFNKYDLVKSPELISYQFKDALFLSATTSYGLEELLKRIDEFLFSHLETHRLLIPYNSGEIYSHLMEKTEVLKTEYKEEGIFVEAKLTPRIKALYHDLIIY